MPQLPFSSLKDEDELHEFCLLSGACTRRSSLMLGPKAAAACREALIGGLEKILEKHHKRMLLDMQQWLDSLDDQTAWDEKTEQIAETGLSSLPCGSLPSGSLKQSRDSARRSSAVISIDHVEAQVSWNLEVRRMFVELEQFYTILVLKFGPAVLLTNTFRLNSLEGFGSVVVCSQGLGLKIVK